MFRITVLCLLFFTSACINTPDGPRSALMFNRTSLLEVDPAEFRAAYQTNLPVEAIPDDHGLKMKFTRDDDTVLIERTITMDRLAQGGVVEFDLPPARSGQNWTVWKPDAEGSKTFQEIQATVADAKSRGDKGTLDINWKFGRGKGIVDTEIVYVTFALRLTPDDPWFTLMDNLPVYPEEKETAK